MFDNFYSVYQYLEKENIIIDKSEFEFQVQSHPDYPSLLSISDTLHFFKIQNIATKVNFSEINLLPDKFISLLNNENSNSQLYFIEKIEDNYFYNDGKKTLEIALIALEKRWNGIVLLVEKNEIESTEFAKKDNLFWVLPSVTFVFLIINLFQANEVLYTKLFMLLPLIGVLFSVAVLKDLFGVNNEVITNFCNMTISSSCTSIIDSSKWIVFKYLKFSDLSMVFFTSQLLIFLFMLPFGGVDAFLSFQKIVLLGSLPIIFLSIYYQKFVEKKWCPICLAIISILLLQIIYLYFIPLIDYNILEHILFFGFIFSLVYLGWTFLRRLLLSYQELKSHQFKAIRFERNYELFKNTLLSKQKTTFPNHTIILGNKLSKTQITIISNPFCGHCKGVHEILERILERHRDTIQINIILKTNLEIENEDAKKIFRSLAKIHLDKGDIAFSSALKNWFDNQNLNKWLSQYNLEINETEFDEIFNSSFKWCVSNNYNFTPAIFINGYEYPQVYERNNLEFFINDLIEDPYFN